MKKKLIITETGGFSYLLIDRRHITTGKISKGEDTPDIHGFVLLTWAISMISEIINLPTSDWKVLKP